MEHFMKKTVLALAAVALLAVPGVAEAQLGIAGRVGTLGVGGEAALGFGDIVIRGGMGLAPLEPTATIDDIEVTLKLPEKWYNIGVDLYLGSAFRIGGGMLFKSEDPTLEGVLTATTDIGGRAFTPDELGTLTGTLDSEDKAPYVLIGFGKHTAKGIGLFLDLGVAFTGDPEITLDATGGTFSDATALRGYLDTEAANFEEDVGSYLKYWPILNIGLRIGVGG
jgi:hypothetical protein